MKRDDFLGHLAWTGTGIAWSLSATGLFTASGAQAAQGGLSFVQISDSHIGFALPANSNVLGTLNNLVADFSSGTVSSTASTDISVLQTALANVSQQRTVLDSSLSRLESAGTYAQTDATNRTATASILVAADPASVATQLSAAEVQNQALMSVISTVEKQSLFDYTQA